MLNFHKWVTMKLEHKISMCSKYHVKPLYLKPEHIRDGTHLYIQNIETHNSSNGYFLQFGLRLGFITPMKSEDLDSRRLLSTLIQAVGTIGSFKVLFL